MNQTLVPSRATGLTTVTYPFKWQPFGIMGYADSTTPRYVYTVPQGVRVMLGHGFYFNLGALMTPHVVLRRNGRTCFLAEQQAGRNLAVAVVVLEPGDEIGVSLTASGDPVNVALHAFALSMAEPLVFAGKYFDVQPTEKLYECPAGKVAVPILNPPGDVISPSTTQYNEFSRGVIRAWKGLPTDSSGARIYITEPGRMALDATTLWGTLTTSERASLPVLYPGMAVWVNFSDTTDVSVVMAFLEVDQA